MRTLSAKTIHGMWSDNEPKKLLINFLHHYLSIKSGRFPDVGSPRHLSHRFNWIFVCLSTDECTNLAPGTSSSIKFAAIVYFIVRNDNSAPSERLLLIYAHKLWRKLLSMLLWSKPLEQNWGVPPGFEQFFCMFSKAWILLLGSNI